MNRQPSICDMESTTSICKARERKLFSEKSNFSETLPRITRKYFFNDEMLYNSLLNDFEFISRIDNDFVEIYDTNCITELSKYILYDKVKYCFFKEFYQRIIIKAIPQEFVNQSFVAGGAFSMYDLNSFFAIHFPEYFRLAWIYQDIDIFVQVDKNNIGNFLKSYNKWFYESYGINLHLLENDKIETRDDPVYKMISFKVNIGTYRINIILSPYNAIETCRCFDFAFCQIFYSFKSNKLFMHLSLFNYCLAYEPEKLVFELRNEDLKILHKLFEKNKNQNEFAIKDDVKRIYRKTKYLMKNFTSSNEVVIVKSNYYVFKWFVDQIIKIQTNNLSR